MGTKPEERDGRWHWGGSQEFGTAEVFAKTTGRCGWALQAIRGSRTWPALRLPEEAKSAGVSTIRKREGQRRDEARRRTVKQD